MAAKAYKAEAPSNANGEVYWEDPELTLFQAIAIRKKGGNVVVRGGAKKENRKLAQQIESGVGKWTFDLPHKNAGRSALPHFHQKPGPDGVRPLPGHTFYEVDKAKAVGKK